MGLHYVIVILTYFCYQLAGKEEAGCFTSFAFVPPCGCKCYVSLPYGVNGWFQGVWSQYVIVAFPSHTPNFLAIFSHMLHFEFPLY